MTSPGVATPTDAVAAFVRGLDRRARLLGLVQSGSREAAAQAMGVVARVFASEARRWPIAQWPAQYWRMLLAAPSMRVPSSLALDLPLAGVARLPAQSRAAVLLLLVAGLDEAAAAEVLQLPVDELQALVRDSLPRDALGHPDVDVWRAWRAAAQRELARVYTPAPSAATAADPWHPPRRSLRWLWVGVVLGLLAFAATFLLHPAGRDAVQRWREPIKRVALPPAQTPRARFDPADPGLHPDRALLAAPAEFRLARDAPVLAWWTAIQPAEIDAEPVQPTVAPVDHGTPRERRQAWDALPHAQRGAQRAAWEAWQALPEAERALLRGAAQRHALLTPDARQALQAQFEQQPADARHGWWLGPWLGAEWPRIAPLFAYVQPDERDALLAWLRQASPADLHALQRLAQTTAPEQRQAVRRQLLGMPPVARSAWLEARFSR
jgi:hypothetical protein